jgi:hypothetical protein
MDAAAEAGADDVVPAEGEEGVIEGYKVRFMHCSAFLQHSLHPLPCLTARVHKLNHGQFQDVEAVQAPEEEEVQPR